MRFVKAADVVAAVRALAMSAAVDLPEDVLEALTGAHSREESPLGREIVGVILENARMAAAQRLPICQDTGMAVVFVDMGNEVAVVDGTLTEAINEGVRSGYADGFLRMSLVVDPVRRTNTGDNTPAIIHLRQVTGDHLRIILAPKGAGSENMSRLAMLKPSDGVEGVKSFVTETAVAGAPNACAPMVVGVGVGGNFEFAPLLAKRALVRTLGTANEDPFWAAAESEILESVNRSGAGPMGLGGRVTALAVQIEVHPCHIASLPVAVNLGCHAHRHREVIL